jgi:hypothetical protein
MSRYDRPTGVRFVPEKVLISPVPGIAVVASTTFPMSRVDHSRASCDGGGSEEATDQDFAFPERYGVVYRPAKHHALPSSGFACFEFQLVRPGLQSKCPHLLSPYFFRF